ncbi:hypothetical protein OAV01_02830 [Opitutales bacterium]|nr:hypothetical protein [Opitutales bacterium]
MMMMKINDFQKYKATLLIPYDQYFSLIYDTKYLLEARLSSGRIFVANKYFYGCNRRKAVEKATDWYSKDLRDVLGPPNQVMMIDDPMEEVIYEEGFICTDLRNKYLDEPTIDRLLKDAGGDLGRDNTTGSGSHPTCSVKRLRRRRKQEVRLTDRLTQSPSGVIYYRMTEFHKGNSSRTKSRKVKLASKSLEKARKEIIRRGLDRLEKGSLDNMSDFRNVSLSSIAV